jgi:SpoVK/Ycf46/Vps4 family AAA+-type ATPase
MDESYISDAARADVGRGYTNQWELMRDFFSLLDYRLYLYYKYHQWVGPDGELRNILGFAVSREEFEHKLSLAAQTGLFTRLNEEERRRVTLGDDTLRMRMISTEDSVYLLGLLTHFELDEFETNCVMLSYAALLEGKYERLFAYLQDDITKKSPGVALAVQLYLPEGGSVDEYISAFSRLARFKSLFDAAALGNGLLRPRSFVAEYLSGGSASLPTGVSLYDGSSEQPGAKLITGSDTAGRLDAALGADWSGGVVLRISGPKGSGKRFQIKRLMTRASEKCIFADVSAATGDVPDFMETADFLARLFGAYLCFYGLDAVEAGGADTLLNAAGTIMRLEPCRDVIFLLTEKPFRRDLGRVCVDIEIPPTDPDGRLLLFEKYLSDVPLAPDVSLRELASKFRFEPLQIKNAAEQAAAEIKLGAPSLGNELLHRICYMQVNHNLDALASRMTPDFTWDDITLPCAQKELLRRACAHVRHSHRVYREWGFGEKISYGRGLTVLFSGAPGTGKTMCAQIMARELSMEAYKIDISRIVSKYIGETEKNLDAIFREARSSGCMLFFDECDALFGKRSEVKDAHDRNANIEVAYLLQQIEEHDGVCILATNLLDNIDTAFMRRITFVVQFPFPNAAERREIYQKLLPRGLSASEDIDWDYIAEKFKLSGGYIKNIVLGAAFMAADEDRPLGMRHLLVAAMDELRKQRIVVVREEFMEYADMLFQDGSGEDK